MQVEILARRKLKTTRADGPAEESANADLPAFHGNDEGEEPVTNWDAPTSSENNTFSVKTIRFMGLGRGEDTATKKLT